MLRTLVCVILLLVLSGLSLNAQQEPYAILFNYEGEITVFRENNPLKLKRKLPLERTDVLDTAGGAAILFYTTGNYYGYFAGISARVPAALEFRLLNEEQAGELARAGGDLAELFFAGTPVPGFQAAERKQYINLVLILDVSTSMRPYFKEVQTFIDETIIRHTLIDGDYFYLYTFGALVRLRIDRLLRLPEDRDLISAVNFAVAPVEEATDIGLALEALEQRLEKNFPHNDTIVFFITDGKNDPPEESPYYGVDIYAADAFQAFETVKKGRYKVMLLAIGEETAAKDLSGPLGGEYIEVAADLTAHGLNNLLSDFIGDVEMIAPTDLGKVRKKALDLKLAFLSSYITDREVRIDQLYYSIDRGDRVEVPAFAGDFTLAANQQLIRTCPLELPAGLERGMHGLRLEVVSGGLSLSGSIQDLTFQYAPVSWLLPLGIVLGLLLLGLIVFIIIRRNM